MSNIIVRSAKSIDVPVMVNLLYQLFSIEKDFTFDEEKHRRGLGLLVEAQSAKVLVAEAGGQVVGMLTAQISISSAEGKIAATLEDMVVDFKFRGQGIGHILMGAMEQWAVSAGISRLQLLADNTNLPALKYYDSLGWQETKMFCLRKYVDNRNA
jgi:GNAT superfamily N-acetyltransferase